LLGCSVARSPQTLPNESERQRGRLPTFEPFSEAGAQPDIPSEDMTMAEEKKEAPKEEVPAHSTEQEKERLKDFNKDGIPPGSS
jgi:hypothetical protein